VIAESSLRLTISWRGEFMKRPICTLAILLLLVNLSLAQSTRQAGTKKDKEASANLQAAAATNVTGSGTPGRLSKWTGVDGSNTFSLGNSNIFEEKFGKIGIGTPTPTSPLTVQGMIETTLGGYKFPDGTIQSTAFSAGQVVSSLNGLRGDVTLAAGSNITITPSGNTLTIAAPNALAAVARDATLQGNGTSGEPLGVAVPLNLTGAVGGSGAAVIQATNTEVSGAGVRATGGRSSNNAGLGGAGVRAFGGAGDGDGAGTGGAGVRATGGDGNSDGGIGVQAQGGNGRRFGGFGIDAIGGDGISGGVGVRAMGGSGGDSNGGPGVAAFGGTGNGAGHRGGSGISARGGRGEDGGTDGLAGEFNGDVEIDGALNVTGTKNFKIDHPLDPENKYLYHAAIESSEVLNVYSGNVTTNEQGEATVTLPDWFEALNKDFRYQLTVVGTFAQAIVAEKVKQNRFTIRTNAPSVEVSWQVTGVRSDAVMRQHPFKAEEEKPERERGYYLSPEAFNQPEERSVEWARRPELMRQMKEARLKQMEATRQKAQSNDR
jgi:trimeric autotransporter adhesin